MIIMTREINMLVLVGKFLWRFDIIFHIRLIFFFFALDIPVMINILYKMIRILYKKMLNAIYLYWFHNDISVENNSLTSHSYEPWINGYRFVLSPGIYLYPLPDVQPKMGSPLTFSASFSYSGVDRKKQSPGVIL